MNEIIAAAAKAELENLNNTTSGNHFKTGDIRKLSAKLFQIDKDIRFSSDPSHNESPCLRLYTFHYQSAFGTFKLEKKRIKVKAEEFHNFRFMCRNLTV